MQITWTSEQHDRREHFRRFGEKVVAPGVAQRDRDGEFDHESWRLLAREGFWSAHLPDEYGGGDGTLWDLLAGLEGLALGAQDSGFVLTAIAHAGLMHVVLEHGTADQKQRLLPALAGGAVGATAATEPTGGSHVAAVATRAVRADAGDGWQLSGQKAHITNAPIADHLLVVGRIDELAPRDITLFLLDRGRPGLSTGAPEDLLGQRTSPTGPIHMEAVAITDADIIGPPGDGLNTLYSFLALDRLMYGIVVAAQLESMLPRVMERVGIRHAFGSPIGEHQYIQDKVVGMRMTIESARHLAYAAADALIHGRAEFSALASCAKIAASEGGVTSTLELIQIFGHSGYDRTQGLERHLRDAVAIRIAGGTTEMQKKNIYKDAVLTHA